MKHENFKISKESVDKLFPKKDIDILGHESPIQIMLGQMRMEQENGIYKAIQEQGIAVDKDELINALRYDREQYDKGYVNGYNADKWISVNDRLPKEYETVLVYGMGLISSDYLTSRGLWYNHEIITHWQPLPTPPEESEDTE